MKRPQSLRVIGFCAVAGLLCIAGSQKAPVHAQSNTTTDDGLFTVYTIIEVDSNNEVSANANGPIADFESEEDENLAYWWLDGRRTWQRSGGHYSASGEGQGFSSGPVPGGSSYTASFSFSIEYYYYNDDDNEDCLSGESESGDCEGWDYLYASASIDVPYPPPQITSLSTYSVTQGDQNTLTINGSNLVENSGDQLTINFSGSGAPFTLASAPSASTASFSYDFAGYPVGTYTLSVSNNEGTSNSETFTVVANSTQPPPAYSCAVTSNPQAGFTSIVTTGTTGGIGTMAVSFSGAAFAALSPSVTYGPYSTPSSIAANIAALITKNYFQYGLSAKAFGPNIVYSGISTLGTVGNVTTGPSFTTTTSSAAAADTESSCESAPPQPPSAVISMHFTGSKNPQDNLIFASDRSTCSEQLGLFNCPTIWLWNLEGTVMVTDDASNWTVTQKIVSGTTTYTYKDSSGTLQSGSYTDPPGPDGPQSGFLQQAAGTRAIFWIDGAGLFKITTRGSTVDSGLSNTVYSVLVCSTVNPSICATKSWSVKIVVDAGQVLDDTFSNASVN